MVVEVGFALVWEAGINVGSGLVCDADTGSGSEPVTEAIIEVRMRVVRGTVIKVGLGVV